LYTRSLNVYVGLALLNVVSSYTVVEFMGAMFNLQVMILLLLCSSVSSDGILFVICSLFDKYVRFMT